MKYLLLWILQTIEFTSSLPMMGETYHNASDDISDFHIYIAEFYSAPTKLRDNHTNGMKCYDIAPDFPKSDVSQWLTFFLKVAMLITRHYNLGYYFTSVTYDICTHKMDNDDYDVSFSSDEGQFSLLHSKGFVNQPLPSSYNRIYHIVHAFDDLVLKFRKDYAFLPLPPYMLHKRRIVDALYSTAPPTFLSEFSDEAMDRLLEPFHPINMVIELYTALRSNGSSYNQKLHEKVQWHIDMSNHILSNKTPLTLPSEYPPITIQPYDFVVSHSPDTKLKKLSTHLPSVKYSMASNKLLRYGIINSTTMSDNKWKAIYFKVGGMPTIPMKLLGQTIMRRTHYNYNDQQQSYEYFLAPNPEMELREFLNDIPKPKRPRDAQDITGAMEERKQKRDLLDSYIKENYNVLPPQAQEFSMAHESFIEDVSQESLKPTSHASAQETVKNENAKKIPMKLHRKKIDTASNLRIRGKFFSAINNLRGRQKAIFTPSFDQLSQRPVLNKQLTEIMRESKVHIKASAIAGLLKESEFFKKYLKMDKEQSVFFAIQEAVLDVCREFKNRNILFYRVVCKGKQSVKKGMQFINGTDDTYRTSLKDYVSWFASFRLGKVHILDKHHSSLPLLNVLLLHLIHRSYRQIEFKEFPMRDIDYNYIMNNEMQETPDDLPFREIGNRVESEHSLPGFDNPENDYPDVEGYYVNPHDQPLGSHSYIVCGKLFYLFQLYFHYTTGLIKHQYDASHDLNGLWSIRGTYFNLAMEMHKKELHSSIVTRFLMQLYNNSFMDSIGATQITLDMVLTQFTSPEYTTVINKLTSTSYPTQTPELHKTKIDGVKHMNITARVLYQDILTLYNQRLHHYGVETIGDYASVAAYHWVHVELSNIGDVKIFRNKAFFFYFLVRVLTIYKGDKGYAEDWADIIKDDNWLANKRYQEELKSKYAYSISEMRIKACESYSSDPRGFENKHEAINVFKERVESLTNGEYLMLGLDKSELLLKVILPLVFELNKAGNGNAALDYNQRYYVEELMFDENRSIFNSFLQNAAFLTRRSGVKV